MTQGAPRTPGKTTPRKTTGRTTAPKPKPNPLVRPSESDQTLDLDQWLADNGLAGRRAMKVGGEFFEFLRAAPFPKLEAYNKARQENDFSGALTHLLVDPDRADDLDKAIDRQAMPIDNERASQMALAMLNFVVYGRTDPDIEQEEKAGESGAS